MEAIYLPKIEFPQMPFGLDKFGKLDISAKLNDHSEVLYPNNNFRAIN
jgi:hypothetical protein